MKITVTLGSRIFARLLAFLFRTTFRRITASPELANPVAECSGQVFESSQAADSHAASGEGVVPIITPASVAPPPLPPPAAVEPVVTDPGYVESPPPALQVVPDPGDAIAALEPAAEMTPEFHVRADEPADCEVAPTKESPLFENAALLSVAEVVTWLAKSPPSIPSAEAAGSSALTEDQVKQELPAATPTISVETLQPQIIRGRRSIVVGVDFGTSTSKVVWQDLTYLSFHVLEWDEAAALPESVLFPSTLLIRDGQIFMGQDAEVAERPGDTVLRTLKICVLCRDNPSICHCQNPGAANGEIEISSLGATYPAAAIACVLLGHLFQLVEARITKRYPNDDIKWAWNIGCPMDFLDSANRKAEWERLAGVAMELRHRMCSPVDVSIIREAAEVLDAYVPAAEETRTCYVQPEGFAAVKAFLEDGRAEDKSYVIVDVGAGTTQVSLFFSGRVGHETKTSYLADSTAAVGGTRIDCELAAATGWSVDEARARKIGGLEDWPDLRAFREIRQQYRHAFADAAKRNKLKMPADKRTDLFTIGGGGRLERLRQVILETPLPGDFHFERRLTLRPPNNLENRARFVENFDLLANACGLASSALEWEYYAPSQVEGMDQFRVRERIDRDERYAK